MKYLHFTDIIASHFNGHYQKAIRPPTTYTNRRNLRNILVELFIVTLLLIAYQPASMAATVFTDDFESGTLDNWTIGGRQLAGPNIADVVTRYDSLMGHLYKNSFTEINFSRNFMYETDLQFNFDMETNVISQSPPAPNYYGSASADFSFLDISGNSLGLVRYASATTSYLFTVYDADPTRHAVQIFDGALEHYSLDVMDLLSLISIDEALIAEVSVRFNAYSSTYPYPAVSAELWVDNFSTVPNIPLPPALYLFGTGLLGLIGIARRKV